MAITQLPQPSLKTSLYKKQERKLVIYYGFHKSPFGKCFLALTDQGICALHFIGKEREDQAIRSFEKKWPNAALNQDISRTQKAFKNIFSAKKRKPIPLFLRGTNFQVKVWKTLTKIPSGRRVTYQEIARDIGLPKSARAVGNAIGANPVGYLIPCHRVIRKDGHLGGYRWGTQVKKAILASEAPLH